MAAIASTRIERRVRLEVVPVPAIYRVMAERGPARRCRWSRRADHRAQGRCTARPDRPARQRQNRTRSCGWPLTPASAPSSSTVGTTCVDCRAIGAPRQSVPAAGDPRCGRRRPWRRSRLVTTGRSSVCRSTRRQSAIDAAAGSDRFDLRGLHLHVGSQICSVDVFAKAVSAVAGLGTFEVYDIGGGLGVRYRRTDSVPSVDDYLDVITQGGVRDLPTRPASGSSRAIACGTSGMTLYRVVTVKDGDPTFVAVDGGIADNLEASTYVGTRFDAVLADRPSGGGHPRRAGRSPVRVR